MFTTIEIGQRFGMLSVIASAHKNGMWVCQCDCGNTIKVYTAALRGGTRKSCGCINQEIQRNPKLKKTHKHFLDHFLHTYAPGKIKHFVYSK